MSKRLILGALLATTIATPVLAQGRPDREARQERRLERQQQLGDTGAQQQRAERALGRMLGARDRGEPQPPRWQNRAETNGGFGVVTPRRDRDGDGIRNGRDRDIDGDGIRNRRDRDRNGDGRFDRRGPAGDFDRDGVVNRRDRDIDGDGIRNRRDGDRNNDGLADRRYDWNRDGRIDGRFDRNRDGRIDRGGFEQRYGYDQRRNWNRGWRADNRYDWQSYRYQNRSIFSPGRYSAPYGYGYGYRRFGIGVTIGSGFFGSRYLISNPYAYRLPQAYPPYRWVRYYNDVLLVDTRDGYVVDAIYDFFY